MAEIKATDQKANEYGYRSFSLGEFRFERDEYFAHLAWPGGSHTMPGGCVLARADARCRRGTSFTES